MWEPLFKMKIITRLSITIGILISSVRSSNATTRKLTDTNFTFITSDHIKIPIKIAGSGIPCMFIPGGPGGGYRSFEQLGGNKLEKFLTMIYADQRGSGSAQNATDYSMDRILKDIDELRSKLHIDRMYLISHSFGGIILVRYALKYPQHVKGIILANSTLHFFNTESMTEQIRYGYGLLGKDTIIRNHNVDTLFKIAQKYDGITVEQLKSLNGVTNTHRLRLGMKLKVPVQS